ncbi:41639_t:CDS:2, partial [Gigaspora margarita]
NASLIIQPVRPSLDDLNPAIKEFYALTKAGIPKNKLAFIINYKVSYHKAQKPK